MLVNIDARYLDWLSAVYLSQDPVAMQEIRDDFDIHSDNQKVFGLPSRLIAKVFLFRLIFGGSEYGFAKDSDFAECRFSVDKWREVIEKFYRKYQGIHRWHGELVRIATTTGILSIPTGRQWKYEMYRDKRGELQWPITQIKNYPVQGLEADLMMIARVSLYNRIKTTPDVLLINSVHDSILVDCANDKVDFVVKTMQDVFRDVPANFKKLFGVEFNLPFRGEIQVGPDWKNMEEVK